MIKPMGYLKNAIIRHTEEKKLFKKAPIFAPAGQSTQVIIGATPENDSRCCNRPIIFIKTLI
jgi:predicted DNA-binding helix-hairpin-helix protein